MHVTSSQAAPRRGRRRWLWVALALLIVGGGAYLFFFRSAPTGSGASQTPEVVPITLKPYDVIVAGPGSLEASTSLNITVAAGMSGRIASIVEVGERVVAGQELARLDPAAFERALKVTEFDLERAQAQLRSLESNQTQARAAADQQLADAEALLANTERTAKAKAADLALVERLHAIGAESDEALSAAREASEDAAQAAAEAQTDLSALITKLELQAAVRGNELSNSQLSVSQAELNFEEAEADLASLTVTAPFSGVVSKVNAVVGAGVNDSTSLLTLIDDATLSLVVQIDETQVGNVQRGQPASATLEALPGQVFSGSVASISPVARLESNIAIFDVVVSLPNPELLLRPGMTAEADIVVRHVPEALTLPSRALTEEDGETSIVVRTTSGETERRAVQVVETVGFQSVVTGDFADAEAALVPVAEPEAGAGGRRSGFGFSGRSR